MAGLNHHQSITAIFLFRLGASLAHRPANFGRTLGILRLSSALQAL